MALAVARQKPIIMTDIVVRLSRLISIAENGRPGLRRSTIWKNSVADTRTEAQRVQLAVRWQDTDNAEADFLASAGLVGAGRGVVRSQYGSTGASMCSRAAGRRASEVRSKRAMRYGAELGILPGCRWIPSCGMGHSNASLSQHYALPDIERLQEMSEKVTISRETVILRTSSFTA